MIMLHHKIDPCGKFRWLQVNNDNMNLLDPEEEKDEADIGENTTDEKVTSIVKHLGQSNITSVMAGIKQ